MATDSLSLYGIGPGGLVELAAPEGAATVHDALAGVPSGVYSTVRTFGGRGFLGLDAHLERLESSMRGFGLTARLDRAELLRALDEVARRGALAGGGADSVIRFDVLAAPVAMGDGQGSILLACAPLRPVPDLALREGVRVETTDRVRRDAPLVKTTDFVRERSLLPAAGAQCYERILLDEEDRILEGVSSTFFGITSRDEVVTAADGVLEGVTRRILLRRAAALEIPIRLERLSRAAAPELAGAFLSSSSRGVVPIVAVDGVTLGDGAPHPIARCLAEDYDEWSIAHARPALALLEATPGD